MGERLKLGETYRLDIPVDDGDPTNPQPVDPAALDVTFRSSAGAAVLTRSIGQLTHLDTGSYRLLATTGPAALLTVGDVYAVEIRTTTPTSYASDWLDLVDAPPGVITLADLKDQLDKSQTRRVNDAELQLYVDAVNEWLLTKAGEILPRTVTDPVVPGCNGAVWLPRRPVLAVVSATYGGTAVDLMTWPTPGPDLEGGRLLVPAGRYPWPSTGAGLVVTYRVGRVPIPATIPVAGRMLGQHLWRSQRTQTPAPVPGGFSDETITVAGVGYAIPNRVAQLVEPYALPAGLA